MEHFNVSRSSLREAMKTMISEGIIVRRHGSGTFLHCIPRKRVELFVRLDNIISPMGNWYRLQIEQLKSYCRSLDIDLEVLVSYGDTAGEEVASFKRHLSRPVTSELLGSIVFFYSQEFEECLVKRGAFFVTVAPLCNAPFQGSAVSLNYPELGLKLAAERKRLKARKPILFYIDDPVEIAGPHQYRELHQVYETILPDTGRHRLIPAMFDVQKFFTSWLDKEGADCDLLIFTDDEVARPALEILGQRKGAYSELRIISHGRPGVFDSLPELCKPVFTVGFEPDRVLRAAWNMLMEHSSGNRQIKVSPACSC